MIQIVLPFMEKNHKGLIINISSFSATYPTPLLSVYGATKTYVDFFSQAIQMEYANKGIICQSVLPAFVSTKMSRMRASFMCPKPKSYVESQMKTVGLETRTYGFPSHKLQGFALDSIVHNIFGTAFVSNIVFNNLKKTRKAAYRKLNLSE